jgi:hypothetical protein
MGSFVIVTYNIYIFFYFLMLLFMNHYNDFASCGPSIAYWTIKNSSSNSSSVHKHKVLHICLLIQDQGYLISD